MNPFGIYRWRRWKDVDPTGLSKKEAENRLRRLRIDLKKLQAELKPLEDRADVLRKQRGTLMHMIRRMANR